MNTSTVGLSIVAEALGVSVQNGDREKHLLDGVTFTVEPGEFICVLGPSGAGKTTLVRALLGLTQPTTGTVSIGGLNPILDADSLRGQVGYVPQQDIIPASLPCERAFYYAAKIRLPGDTPGDDIRRAINRVVNDVRLEHVRHTPARILSGGEIKRGSLAVELLSNPGLLIVDEATSSLDPASEARIMNLLADRARAGMTVFCITHHLDNVDRADKIMILGHGRVLWIGSRVESLGHFEVNRLSDVYLAIEDKPAAYWADKWTQRQAETALTKSPTPSQSSVPLRATRNLPPNEALQSRPPRGLRQFGTLLSRGLEVILRDRPAIAMLLLLPVAMASLILLCFYFTDFHRPVAITRFLDPNEKDVLADVWGDVQQAIAAKSVSDFSGGPVSVAAQIRVFLDSQPDMLEHLRDPSTQRLIQDALLDKMPLMPQTEIVHPADSYKLLFVVNIAITILGFVTGVKEIVKEKRIYVRERMHSLGIIPYTLSKLALVAIILAVQVAIFLAVIDIAFYLPLDMQWDGGPVAMYRRGALLEFGYNFLSAVACAAIGMIVSALVRSSETAFLAVPLLVTPQLLLGAGILPIRGGLLDLLAKVFAPAYWAYRGVRSEGAGVPINWRSFGPYDDALWIPLVGLLAQIAVATICVMLVLRWQDQKRS